MNATRTGAVGPLDGPGAVFGGRGMGNGYGRSGGGAGAGSGGISVGDWMPGFATPDTVT